MTGPYREPGRVSKFFVDSDGDIYRLDRIQFVHYKDDGTAFPYTICFMDGTKYHISAEDGAELKKLLTTL